MIITEASNQMHERKKFTVYSGVTSHMVKLEENMTNLKDVETQFTIGDRRILTRSKRGN